MGAPLLLALSAPVTLALRGTPRRVRVRARLLRVLRSRAVRAISAPAVVLVVAVGSLYGLYLTRCTPSPRPTGECTSRCICT